MIADFPSEMFRMFLVVGRGNCERLMLTVERKQFLITGDIYRWLVHLLIYSDKDPAHKLMNFLLENGVDENDLEYGMHFYFL